MSFMNNDYTTPKQLIWGLSDYTKFEKSINWDKLHAHLKLSNPNQHPRKKYKEFLEYVNQSGDPSLQMWFSDFRIHGCLMYPLLNGYKNRIEPFNILIDMVNSNSVCFSAAIEQFIYEKAVQSNAVKGNEAAQGIRTIPQSPVISSTSTSRFDSEIIKPRATTNLPADPLSCQLVPSTALGTEPLSCQLKPSTALGTFNFSLYKLLLQQQLIGETCPLQTLCSGVFNNTRPIRRQIHYPNAISVPVVDYSFKKLKIHALLPLPQTLDMWMEWMKNNANNLANLKDSEFRKQILEFFKLSTELSAMNAPA